MKIGAVYLTYLPFTAAQYLGKDDEGNHLFTDILSKNKHEFKEKDENLKNVSVHEITDEEMSQLLANMMLEYNGARLVVFPDGTNQRHYVSLQKMNFPTAEEVIEAVTHLRRFV